MAGGHFGAAPPGIGGAAGKVASYKTVLLGEASVGKTSIVHRLITNSFSENTDTTIGASFCPHTVDVDGHLVKFEIWDTAGQERFASLAPMYYRRAAAAIVVYDQTRLSSFTRASAWVQQLQVSTPNVVICLAANKADCAAKAVPIAEAKQYAEREGLIFVETSAKTGLNIEAMFYMIAKRLPDRPQEPQIGGGMTLAAEDEQQGGGLGSGVYSYCCGN